MSWGVCSPGFFGGPQASVAAAPSLDAQKFLLPGLQRLEDCQVIRSITNSLSLYL